MREKKHMNAEKDDNDLAEPFRHVIILSFRAD
jgi:hypothetical protein